MVVRIVYILKTLKTDEKCYDLQCVEGARQREWLEVISFGEIKI